MKCLANIYLRLLHSGTALPKFCLEAASTPPVSTCGPSAPSSPRCAPASHCSPVIRRSTRSSRSSGECLSLFLIDSSADVFLCSVLGTPDEEIWPGVTSFPDYKATFPKWKRPDVAIVPGLEQAGLELLEALLEYDPAHRLSAKQACMHPYFRNGSSYYSGRTSGARNGYH